MAWTGGRCSDIVEGRWPWCLKAGRRKDNQREWIERRSVQLITTINYHNDDPPVISVLYKQYLNTSVKYIFI